MSQPPTVSIILPTYNGASGFLDHSIQSCLNQSYSEWELIIVDDASTDHTHELVSRYVDLDPRIRCIKHSTNRKLPAALNTGFEQSSGRYHTWTSDDNYYKLDALGELVAYLERHNDVDIVYTDYTLVDQDGAVLGVKHICDVDGLLQNSCIGPSFLCRSIVFTTLGSYSDEFFLAEDYDFWLRASAHFQLQPLHKNLYYYRVHQDSLTSKLSHEQALALESALNQNLPSLTWVDSRGRSIANLRLFELALRRFAIGPASRYFARAVRSSPAVVAAWLPHKIWRGTRRFIIALARN
jgi:glycosyltransferase involved in cell wall biosynthesis